MNLDTAQNQVAKGDAVGIVTVSNQIATIQGKAASGTKFETAAFPATDTAADTYLPVGLGAGYGVNAKSKNQALAKKFINYFMSKQGIDSAIKNGSIFPSIADGDFAHDAALDGVLDQASGDKTVSFPDQLWPNANVQQVTQDHCRRSSAATPPRKQRSRRWTPPTSSDRPVRRTRPGAPHHPNLALHRRKDPRWPPPPQHVCWTRRQRACATSHPAHREDRVVVHPPGRVLLHLAVLIPSVQGSLFAFTDWDGISATKNWVGFKQFADVFSDPNAVTAIRNTILVGIAVTIVQNVLGLLVALGVNSRIKSRNVLRVLIFAPVVITSVAVGFLWQNLLAPEGAVNQALGAVGLQSLQQDWLGNSKLAIWSVIFVVIWQFVGYSMVIFLAGLQGIPEEVLEAAAIDGAGPIRRFWSVVRPMLAPAITINLMLSIIGGLKLFDQVITMTQGGPGGASNTISTLIYQNAFQLSRFGYGSALAVLLTIFVAIVSAVQYGLLNRQGK